MKRIAMVLGLILALVAPVRAQIPFAQPFAQKGEKQVSAVDVARMIDSVKRETAAAQVAQKTDTTKKTIIDTTKKNTTKKTIIDTAGHAFTYKPVTQSEFVEAVRNCNPKILRITCKQLVESSNKFIPGHKFEDNTSLAVYIGSLVSKPCPVGPALLGRIKRGVVEGDWPRPLKVGETCLYDSNEAVWRFSLSCGNVITSSHSVASAMATPQEAVVATTGESPAPVAALGRPMTSGRPLMRTQTGVSDWTAEPADRPAPPKLEGNHFERNWWKYTIGGAVVVVGVVAILKATSGTTNNVTATATVR